MWYRGKGYIARPPFESHISSLLPRSLAIRPHLGGTPRRVGRTNASPTSYDVAWQLGACCFWQACGSLCATRHLSIPHVHGRIATPATPLVTDYLSRRASQRCAMMPATSVHGSRACPTKQPHTRSTYDPLRSAQHILTVVHSSLGPRMSADDCDHRTCHGCGGLFQGSYVHMPCKHPYHDVCWAKGTMIRGCPFW